MDKEKDNIPKLKATSRDILKTPIILGQPGVGKTVPYWRTQDIDDISNPLSKYSYKEFLKLNEEAKNIENISKTHIGEVIGFECLYSTSTETTVIASKTVSYSTPKGGSLRKL